MHIPIDILNSNANPRPFLAWVALRIMGFGTFFYKLGMRLFNKYSSDEQLASYMQKILAPLYAQQHQFTMDEALTEALKEATHTGNIERV